jgi:hypothetical protein
MGIIDKIKSIQQEGTIVRASRYEEDMQHTKYANEFLLTTMKREFGKFYIEVVSILKESEEYVHNVYKYTSIEERDKDWELITNYLDDGSYDGMWEVQYKYTDEDVLPIAISKTLSSLQEYMISDFVRVDTKKYTTDWYANSIKGLEVYTILYDEDTGQPKVFKYLKANDPKCSYDSSKLNKDHYYTEYEIEPVYWTDFKIRQSNIRQV